MNNFFAELKRRNVYKVAAAYAVVSWLLIQGASIVLPTFEAPGSAMKVLIAALAVGFPLPVILAWAFEITPEGIVRAEDVPPNESIAPRTGRKIGRDHGRAGGDRGWSAGVPVLALETGDKTVLSPTAAPSVAAVTPLIPAKSIAVLPLKT